MPGIQPDTAARPKGAEAAPKPVIVLAGGNSVQPLAAQFEQDKLVEKRLAEDYDLAILYPQVADMFRVMGLAVIKMDDGMTPVDNNNGINWAALRSARLVQSLRSKRSKIKQCFPDGGVFDQVAKELVNWLPGYTVSTAARMHSRLTNWKRMWNARDVRLVVVHEDVAEDTRSLVQFANAQGTPTLHVPHYNHGTIPGEPPDLHDKLYCDYVAVAGDYMADWYGRRGVESKRIRVTGHPMWDRFAGMQPDRYWARGTLRLDPRPPTVCYAADWVLWTTLCYDETTPERGWRTMLDAFKLLYREGWGLICKAHPGAKATNDQWHAKVAKEEDAECLVTARHLDIILQAADVIVSNGFSNVITEAAMVGMPGLTLGPGYLDEMAVPSVPYEAEALYRAIKGVHEQRQMWHEKLRPAFLEKYAGPNDGKATERIMNWCRELAGG